MKQEYEQFLFCLQISALQRQPWVDHRLLRVLLEKEGRALDLKYFSKAIPAASSVDSCDQKMDAYDMGIRACCLSDDCYPKRLRQTSGCPLVLYYRGKSLLWNHPVAVTVVGTRKPSQYGRKVTQKIVSDLVCHDILIISGLARGIDGLAHRTALEKKGLTLAVVAHGIDFVYPPEHHQLMESIIQNGVVVSEHPPGIKPKRSYFPARNRILSGLSDVVAVMEAKKQSGTLITAGFAADQGRDVLAVPGDILTLQNEGCHQLIREGAGLLESANDVLAALPNGLPSI